MRHEDVTSGWMSRMSNGSEAFVWLGICGFIVVIVGLLAVGAFMILRRLSLRDAVSLFTFAAKQEDELEDSAVPRRSRPVDLRSKAEQVSFDDALARYQGQPSAPSALDDEFTPNLPPSRFDHQPPRRETPRRRKPEGYSDDEVFGGMLDVDGDGDPDY